jgi:hypothetical protein
LRCRVVIGGRVSGQRSSACSRRCTRTDGCVRSVRTLTPSGHRSGGTVMSIRTTRAGDQEVARCTSSPNLSAFALTRSDLRCGPPPWSPRWRASAVRRGLTGVNSVDMNGGQVVVVGVGLALILVIAVAVAAFVWRERVLDRRRTPDERYRRAVLDVRRVQTDLGRHSDRLRGRQSDPPESSGAGGAGGAF